MGQMANSLLDVSQVNPQCVKKSATFEGGTVMVWEPTNEGVGPLVRIIGTNNANVYFTLYNM